VAIGMTDERGTIIWRTVGLAWGQLQEGRINCLPSEMVTARSLNFSPFGTIGDVAKMVLLQ
jgi:hypothetical protein